MSVENNQNVIEWEKPNSQTIENFNVYRESDVNNLYNFLGSIPYDSVAVYVDTTANPSMKAYRYVISFTTINNIESDYSPHHQTIHNDKQRNRKYVEFNMIALRGRSL